MQTETHVLTDLFRARAIVSESIIKAMVGTPITTTQRKSTGLNSGFVAS